MRAHASRWIVGVLGGWFLLAIGDRAAASETYSFYHDNVMGTSMELQVQAASEDAARAVESRVLHEIDRLSRIFSGYDPQSEFSRWQAGPRQPTVLSAELFELLQACDQWRAKSGGAFDPRVELLSRLWSNGARRNQLPTEAELDRARDQLSRPAWRLDPERRTAERLSDGPLSLNAIAKGYILERACEAATNGHPEVQGLLLNVGGDLRVCGSTVGSIGISAPKAGSETTEPLALVEVQNRAVATSGNYQRGWSIQGKWYSHVLDPRTGRPAEGIASASVIAERSADADALATIFNVLSPEESRTLANSIPGVECLIITTEGRMVRSDGWRRYERARTSPVALADTREPSDAKLDKGIADDGNEAKATTQASWGDDHELVIHFEINRPEGEARRRYRLPYVAIWVEDEKGFPVRTLALWVSLGGAGPDRWLPDLKRWYRSDRARREVDKTDMVHAMARATAPPGKYSVIWDGKDNHGKPLPGGSYTIYIEAVREHGTYQSIRKPVTLPSTPFAEDLKGNVEIKSASIEYRRKTPAK